MRSRQTQMDGRWHNTQLDQPRSAKLGKPDDIVLVGLCPRTLPYVTAMGHEHLTRVTQHMIYRLPGDARTLQDDYGAMVVLQPRAKRDKLTLGRTTVVEFRRDLARVTDPARTRGALGGMGVNTTADRMEHLHRASLLNSGWLAWGTPALPALKATPSRTIPVLPFSGCADSLKQPDTGLPVDDDLKHGRATLPLGFLIGSDKSFHRGWTHVCKAKVIGYAAKIPWVRVS